MPEVLRAPVVPLSLKADDFSGHQFHQPPDPRGGGRLPADQGGHCSTRKANVIKTEIMKRTFPREPGCAILKAGAQRMSGSWSCG